MTGNELRSKFLKFYEERGHTAVPSASLVPENDPTTLFTGSGMQPMLPYLLGEKSPYGSRIVDSQRCFRVQDIEEVGDNRHTTAFEMLGNWSLGDYFKAEQLNWFWEFLTKEVGIDPHKLYVTVFAGNDVVPRDDEAIAIWKKSFASVGIEAKLVDGAADNGMQDGRIFTYPAKKNWWSRSGVPENMPAGEPGGPDSEVFYEFTDVEHDTRFGPHCHVNCDCGRFLEIGNNVFMQYQKQEDGSFKELPQKNIDFGGGLERMLGAVNDTSDLFVNDLHWPIIERVVEISGRPYEGEDRYPYQVIADHLKAAVFLLSDGVIPSNKAQGYVLRRVIRRAVRFGRSLGIEKPFMAEAAEAVRQMYGELYPSVKDEQVAKELAAEEEKFLQTLDRGLKEVQKFVDHLGEDRMEVADVAHQAFDFYQTFGLPVDIFIDELIQHGGYEYSIDERLEIQDLAQAEFAKHQELSRQGSVGMFKGGLGSHGDKEIQYHTTTHLLQQALRDVLGDTVIQRGSNITPERLRFDFTAENRLTDEQKRRVEEIVNEKIAEELPVSFTVLPIEEAEKTGAIHAFGEKYGEAVKVYSIGGEAARRQDGENDERPVFSVQRQEDGKHLGGGVDSSEVESSGVRLAQESDTIAPRSEVYSREFCGGPHVANTSEIKGTFKIQKDEKISRDVVRVKAVLE